MKKMLGIVFSAALLTVSVNAKEVLPAADSATAAVSVKPLTLADILNGRVAALEQAASTYATQVGVNALEQIVTANKTALENALTTEATALKDAMAAFAAGKLTADDITELQAFLAAKRAGNIFTRGWRSTKETTGGFWATVKGTAQDSWNWTSVKAGQVTDWTKANLWDGWNGKAKFVTGGVSLALIAGVIYAIAQKVQEEKDNTVTF